MTSKRTLLLLILLAFMFAGAIQLFFILRINGGQLVYILDDAYIHLRVSEQIARGGYGINDGVYNAPASSIIWPFLLAPWSGSAVHLWVPLLLCVLASAGTLIAIADIWDRLIPITAPNRARKLAGAVILTGIGAGVLVLPWTGMEHSLQALTAVLVLRGMIREWSGESPGSLFSAGVIVGSLTRYENAMLSVVLLGVLFFRGKRRLALLHLAAVGVLLCGASLIIHQLTGDWLPSSILVKQARSTSALTSMLGYIHPPVERLTLFAAAGLVIAACRRRLKGSPAAVTGWVLAAFCVLNAITVPLHNYQRYDAYLLAPLFCFAGVIMFASQSGVPSVRMKGRLAEGLLVLGWVFAFKASFLSIIIPLGSNEIFRQQYQMASFVQSAVKSSSAANDIGVLSYGNRHFVLDLYGLASKEARIAFDRKEAGWMNRLARRHRVPVALIYEEWFPEMIPCSWLRVGVLRMPDEITFSVGGRRVGVYSTQRETAGWLHRKLREYLAENTGTDFQLEPEPRSPPAPCDAAAN